MWSCMNPKVALMSRMSQHCQNGLLYLFCIFYFAGVSMGRLRVHHQPHSPPCVCAAADAALQQEGLHRWAAAQQHAHLNINTSIRSLTRCREVFANKPNYLAFAVSPLPWNNNNKFQSWSYRRAQSRKTTATREFRGLLLYTEVWSLQMQLLYVHEQSFFFFLTTSLVFIWIQN